MLFLVFLLLVVTQLFSKSMSETLKSKSDGEALTEKPSAGCVEDLTST